MKVKKGFVEIQTRELPKSSSNELQLTKIGHKRVRRGNVNDAESIKRTLIEAAKALFVEGGLEAVTMRSVASRAEVAAMTPYTYFKNKSDLLWHIRNDVIEELVEDQLLAIAGQKTARGAIKASIVAYIKYWANRQDEYQLMYLPSSIKGGESSVWGDTSNELEALRDLQIRITTAFANEIGGRSECALAATNFRHATTLGILQLNLVNRGQIEFITSHADLMAEVMLDSVELLLRKQYNDATIESLSKIM